MGVDWKFSPGTVLSYEKPLIITAENHSGTRPL